MPLSPPKKAPKKSSKRKTSTPGKLTNEERLQRRIDELEAENATKQLVISGLQGSIKALKGTILDHESKERDQTRRMQRLGKMFSNSQGDVHKLAKEKDAGTRYRSIVRNRDKFSDPEWVQELREFVRLYIVRLTIMIAKDVKAERMASMNLFEVNRIVQKQCVIILKLLRLEEGDEIPQFDERKAKRIVDRLDGDAIEGLENLLISLLNKDYEKLAVESFDHMCNELEEWNDELNRFIHECRPSIPSLQKGLKIVKQKNIFPPGCLFIEEMERSFDNYEPSSVPVALPKSQGVERDAGSPRQRPRASWSGPSSSPFRAPQQQQRNDFASPSAPNSGQAKMPPQAMDDRLQNHGRFLGQNERSPRREGRDDRSYGRTDDSYYGSGREYHERRDDRSRRHEDNHCGPGSPPPAQMQPDRDNRRHDRRRRRDERGPPSHYEPPQWPPTAYENDRRGKRRSDNTEDERESKRARRSSSQVPRAS